jgi:hypothetical protein
VSSIKKILNKKIKLNSHVKFDDDGELLGEGTIAEQGDANDSDSGDSITPIPLAQYESQDREEQKTVGGIQIKEAQEKLQVQDRIDRDFEKERIRQLHREKRLKRKRQAVGSDRVGEAVSLEAGQGDGEDDESSSKVGRKRQRKAGGEGVPAKVKRRRGVEHLSGEEGVESGGRKEVVGSVDGEGVVSEALRGKEVGSGRKKQKKQKRNKAVLETEPELLADEELAKHLLGI